MIKKELISMMAARSGLSKAQAALALSAFVDTVAQTLAAGEAVQLVGFGTFDVKVRESRTGRNPATGQPLAIPAARLPVFKPGKELKEAVDGQTPSTVPNPR